MGLHETGLSFPAKQFYGVSQKLRTQTPLRIELSVCVVETSWGLSFSGSEVWVFESPQFCDVSIIDSIIICIQHTTQPRFFSSKV